MEKVAFSPDVSWPLLNPLAIERSTVGVCAETVKRVAKCVVPLLVTTFACHVPRLSTVMVPIAEVSVLGKPNESVAGSEVIGVNCRTMLLGSTQANRGLNVGSTPTVLAQTVSPRVKLVLGVVVQVFVPVS